MIKAIFFDVDGTLLSHKQKKVPESTREAMFKLRAQGIKTVIATGRHEMHSSTLALLNNEYETEHQT